MLKLRLTTTTTLKANNASRVKCTRAALGDKMFVSLGIRSTCLWIAILIVGTLTTTVGPAQATVTPSALGTYSGSGVLNESGCINPPFSDSSTFTITITVDTQQNGSFSGSGSLLFDDGEVTSVVFNATIFGDGSIGNLSSWTSTEANGDQSAGTFPSGQLTGSNLTINFIGADIGGDMCTLDGSFTATRGAIDPAATSGTGAITPIVFFATVGTPAALTGTRTRSALKSLLTGDPSTGAVPVANGFMLQGGDSAAAGDDFDIPWGSWISYSHSDYEDDFVSTAFEAKRNNLTVGIDFSPWDHIVAGISLGYENNDIDTTFNGGNMDSDMFTVAPYIGGLINDTFSVDFSAGYSTIGIDQFRTQAGARITSSVDAVRWFVAGNLNANREFGNWFLSGRAGLLYANEEQDAFAESAGGAANPARSFELGQLRIGGDIAYSWGAFETFATAVYAFDYSRDDIIVGAGIPQPANDNDDVSVGLGIRWYGDTGISAAVEWSSVLGREDFDDSTYSFLLRADF